jgi:molybdate transport system substrate-binding protein
MAARPGSSALIGFCLALWSAGCGDGGAPAGGGKAPGALRPVLLLAAASTKDALEEIARDFERTGGAVQVVPGGSNALAAQILNGAPADLFLSASEEWARAVEEKGLAIESRPLLGNRLAAVVPRGNPAAVRGPADLRSVKHLALAGERVPAGKYGEEALRSLGLYEELLDGKRIARGDDVRIALRYVEQGEAEAGIVYASDARASKSVEVAFLFDSGTHGAIVYPLVLLKGSAGKDSARRLFDHLASPPAGAVFTRYGFSLVPGK